MRDTIDKLLKQTKDYFAGLERKDRLRFIILAAVVVALSITAAILLSRTTWAVLDSGIDPATANKYATALDELGIKYKLADGGTAVLVPDTEVTNARVKLSGTSVLQEQVDLSIYANAMSVGSTAEDKRFFEERQKEALIEAAIGSNMINLNSVEVMLALGSTSSYVTAIDTPTTASIIVDVTGGGKLSGTQAQTIIELAAGAVSGLLAENVKLADTRGYMYSIGGQMEDTEGAMANQLAITEQTRSALKQQLTNLFIPVVGIDNVEVAVGLELDFDETTIDSIEFAPPVDGMEEGLIISLYQLWENTREGVDAEGVPGSDSNGIGTVEYPYTEMDEDDYYRKYINEINYEINQTRTTITKAKGAIKGLSVGIMINSDAISADYTAGFASVAAAAMGVDQRYVTVYSVPFNLAAAGNSGIPGNNGEEEIVYDVISLGIKAAVVLLLGLAMMMLIYQLFKRPTPQPAPQLTLVESTGVEYVADDEMDLDDFNQAFEEEPVPEPALAEIIEPEPVEEIIPPTLAEIEAAAKTDGIVQLEKYIDKDPAAVAQLLRNWLTD